MPRRIQTQVLLFCDEQVLPLLSECEILGLMMICGKPSVTMFVSPGPEEERKNHLFRWYHGDSEVPDGREFDIFVGSVVSDSGVASHLFWAGPVAEAQPA